MAYYRRCLSIRASLLARRCNSSFCYISHEDDRAQMRQPISRCDGWTTPLSLYPSHKDDHSKLEEHCPSKSAIDSYVSQRRSFHSYVKSSPWRCSGVFFGVGSGLVGNGMCKDRYMSTSGETLAEELKKIVISDHPVLGEIIPATESSLPVLAAQYLIDGVHSITGLNWRASIALTIMLIRGVTIPFLIIETKSFTKFQLRLLLLQLWQKEISKGQHIMKDMDPESLAEMKKHISIPSGPSMGFLPKGIGIRGPVFVSFFIAVMIMVDKVPSFRSGGAFWFTDLTTPDFTFILPSLTLLSFLACFESFWREKFEIPNALGCEEVLWKWCFRWITASCVVSLPFSILLPKAIYCYMLTSNLFSLCIHSCLKNPNVRKALRFPEMPVPPPSFYSIAMRREKWPSILKR